MNNIHPHQANGEDFLMVEVPEVHEVRHILTTGAKTALYIDASPYIVLPRGTYTILGLGSELSEPQKAMVCQCVFQTPRLYANYMQPVGITFNATDRTESLSSLCTSKGMQLKNTLFIKKTTSKNEKV